MDPVHQQYGNRPSSDTQQGTSTLTLNEQLIPERLCNFKPEDVEAGHKDASPKTRWPFTLKVFKMVFGKDNQTVPEEEPLYPGHVQLSVALTELYELCDRIRTPDTDDNQMAETDVLTIKTSKIIAALDLLITANERPRLREQRKIDMILRSIGELDGFLNSFQSFSNSVIIQHNGADVFDSPELKWALFQIYWMLRYLAQHTSKRRDQAIDKTNHRVFSKLSPYLRPLSHQF
jgi:hypothetical protein